MNVETIALRLPDYGDNMDWGWYNSNPYEGDELDLLMPGEFWAVFFFKKKVVRPGESKYFSSEIVKYLVPKGYDILTGESFNMN